MNECFDLTAMHEASDGWTCFGLITGFTQRLRIAVNQGPHYKSCMGRRASSHPHLMSQQILPLCCLLVSWELKWSAAFFCQVKLFILFYFLFQMVGRKPIKNKFLILQYHLQCMLALMPCSITLIKPRLHFETKNKRRATVLLFKPWHLIEIPSTHSYKQISLVFNCP